MLKNFHLGAFHNVLIFDNGCYMYTKKARGSFSYEKKGYNAKVDATTKK
jgi:hypothetical protein